MKHGITMLKMKLTGSYGKKPKNMAKNQYKNYLHNFIQTFCNQK